MPLCEPQRGAASHPCHGEAPPGAEAISYTVGETASAGFGPPRGDMSRGNGAKRRLALCPPASVSWRAAVGGDAISRPAGKGRLPLTHPSQGIASGPGRSSAAPLQGPRNDMVRLSTDYHRFFVGARRALLCSSPCPLWLRARPRAEQRSASTASSSGETKLAALG